MQIREKQRNSLMEKYCGGKVCLLVYHACQKFFFMLVLRWDVLWYNIRLSVRLFVMTL
jgi:hypothetical protein